MKLTDSQKSIVAFSLLQAELSAPKLAATLGMKEASVRRALTKLIDDKILIPLTYINVYALGLRYYDIWFSLSPGFSEKKPSLLDWLVGNELTAYVGEFAGDYDIKLSILVKDPVQFEDFFFSLTETFGKIIGEKSFALKTSLTDFPLPLLDPESAKIDALAINTASAIEVIDEMDHSILSALSARKSMSNLALARELGVPESTLKYRIDKLKERGVITGHRYLFDATLCNMQYFAFTISVDGLSREFDTTFRSFCHQHPNAYAMERCIGAWDYEVSAVFDNPSSVKDFTDSLCTSFKNIAIRVRPISMLKHHKVSQYPLRSI